MEGLAIRGAIDVVVSLLVAAWAFKHRSLSKSGAFMRFLVLSVLIAASYWSGSVFCFFWLYSSFVLRYTFGVSFLSRIEVFLLSVSCFIRFGAIILVFFVTSSKLTKIGEDKTRGADDSFKVGGQRVC
ncbi:hypothetical protein EJ110_NYTH31465 [Nymphaea thermarum]|nr:hypothetical protein EJ110_NYTH31465 [Nymphaea thermarum]